MALTLARKSPPLGLGMAALIEERAHNRTDCSAADDSPDPRLPHVESKSGDGQCADGEYAGKDLPGEVASRR